jgi:hypothetical protein
MITVYKPSLEKQDNSVTVSAKFNLNNNSEVLWYSFPKEFEEYVVIEQLDGFLVGLLFLALKTGNDIKLEGPISARLLYTLNNYVIDALCLINPVYKKIKIIAESAVSNNFNKGGVAGTGMSCGVDSFTTYCDHVELEPPYKIDYFLFCNVGSHGDFGGQKARRVFFERMENVEGFTKETNRKLIPVDSNLSEILKMKFQQTYNFRTISCVLLLQKLFKNYYYSSGTRFDHFSFNKEEIADVDMLIIPNLSTESTTMFVSALKYSRIQRTGLIANFPETFNHLDVCTQPANKRGGKLNCSKCYKCTRTMLTLDLWGKLDHYSNVFDICYFIKNKHRYIGKLISKKKKLTLDREMIEFFQEKGIPAKAYFYAFQNILFEIKKDMKKKIYR